MSSHWRTLRRRILTPDSAQSTMAVRGFEVKNETSKELLETIGSTFLDGYGTAVEARSTTAAEDRLQTVPERFRGFAYEGAAMGFAVLDALPPRGRRVTRFLAGRGTEHLYMAYIGVGWALARLPRLRWPSIEALDPLLRWLLLDGYGFHQAYFHTREYVHEQYRENRFAWPDAPLSYAQRVIDQGIGRALWFVAGTDPEVAGRLIDAYPGSRHADLYSGAGLAATYAGGVSTEELRLFFERAGKHQPDVAQGSAFAAEARLSAGLHVPHTGLATEVFCGRTPEEAAEVCRRTRPIDTGTHDGVPAFEVWRRRIADEFVLTGRS
ncbi:enediyne biosynthesis protein [Amycolatopsis sp. WAC 01376]|uniref:DUF1702 family protein n=1 Tax=Amycolatopsis sp. WAC 01376 TaxID=2203195 RepID=UPI000F79B5AB|nr:enediyne biosynthesis protein [Amycolatopsis sp. WAC 01376]